MPDPHAATCPCSCHGGGPWARCDQDGGCAHLHDDAPAATSRCVVDGRRSRRDGGLTCWRCYDLTREMLDPGNLGDDDAHIVASIPVLFARLDPRPGTGAPGRRAPGFAAAIPISAHIAAMRDPRSQANGAGPTRSADPDHPDQQNPPLYAGNVLGGWVHVLCDERSMGYPTTPDTRPRHADFIGPMTRDQAAAAATALPPPSVTLLARTLLTHLDWITRQPWVDEMVAELRELRDQLRPATGDARPRPVGRCPNTVDVGDTTRECGTPLRVPLYGDAVRCGGCGRTWPREEWLRLGDLIASEATT